MNDKPEAVAWLYEIPGANHRYAYAERHDCAEGWTETPLYPAPITLHESQVRWRQAFDEMHQRAMKAEAALVTQPDASALVEAIVEAALDVANVVSHDGYYEIDRDAAVRAALSAWEAQHG